MQAADPSAIWKSHYVHHGGWARGFAAQSLPSMLAAQAERTPAAPAVDFLGRRYTYRRLWLLVRRAAAGFAGLGVARGVKVGLFLPNGPHYVIAYYAVLLAGGTVVNLSPLYAAEETARQIDDSGTAIVVTLDTSALYEIVAPRLGQGALRTFVVGTHVESLPFGSALAERLRRRVKRATVPADAAHVAFKALLANAPLASPPAIDPATDVALLQYTAGTGGPPRGALLTHANLSVNIAQLTAIDPQTAPPDRVLAVLPFFHIFANIAVLNQTIARGGLLVLVPRFDAATVLETLVRARITLLLGTPGMFRAMLETRRLGQLDLGALRLCTAGGAPLPDAVKREFEIAARTKLVEGYGLTETGIVSVNPIVGPGKAGSVGQPLPRTSVRIVDSMHATRPAAADEPGEIVVAGPQVMAGYHHAADDAARFVTIDGTRYFRTGDLGLIDAAGYIVVVNRRSDVIEVGGVPVFPSRVEQILYTNPDVREAVVVGLPDQRLGERPKAFIAVMLGAEGSPEAFANYVNLRVGRHEQLTAVEFRDALPKTAVGKIDRGALIAEERRKMGFIR